MSITSYDYDRAYRTNKRKDFAFSLHFYLESTKPLILVIESASIYERFAVARSLVEILQEYCKKLNFSSKLRYAFNNEDFEQVLQFASNNDIVLVDCQKALDPKFRKQIELKNLNYLILTHQPVDYSYTYHLKIYKEKDDIFYCLIHKKNFPLGYVDIRKRAIDYDQLLEEVKSPVLKIIEGAAASTKKLLRKMYIPQEIIFLKKSEELRKTENGIIPQKVLIYGDVGTGKSTLLEIFHRLDLEHYGDEHVHAKLHEDDLNSLLIRGWSRDAKKFIQSIAVEDYTYKGEKDLFTMHSFINLRHTMNERTGGTREDRTTGIQQGMSKCRICLHRLTGDATPTAYRSSFDFQIFLGFPTLKFDRDYIEQIIGPMYVAVLKYITEKRNNAKESGKRKEYKSWLGWGVWVYGEAKGVFYLPTDHYSTESIPILDAPEGSDEEEEITHWHDWEIAIRNKASEELAFDYVDFPGRDPIRINLWGSKRADVPRWDVDLTEQYLIETHPETRELIPKRRRSLAADVFKRAKFLQYSEIAPERLEEYHSGEKDEEQQLAYAKKNWEKIAQKGIDHFSTLDSKPALAEINAWVLDLWKYKKKQLPKSISRITFFSNIVTRIRAALEKEFLNGKTDPRESTDLVIHPGSIVDKYRSMLKDHGESIGQEQAFADLIQNHFELKSYQAIGVERSVGKNTISSNVQRALKAIHKNAISGTCWEASIFSWMYEQLEKISREKNLAIDKIVDGQVVDAYPSRVSQSYFAALVRPFDYGAYSCATIDKIVESFSANPPFSSENFLSDPPGLVFFFFWLGGKSCVDFVLFAAPGSGSLAVFDAKVSHQTYLKHGPHTSHTVSHEVLVPQSLFLSSVTCSKGSLLFWSPFIGARFAPQASPDQSVTINRSSPLLEDSLLQLLEEQLVLLARPSGNHGGSSASPDGPGEDEES
ncbi:MAG: hypothetical protein HZR80_21180 [Candidatus Heimdallarchaeota archaeon]